RFVRNAPGIATTPRVARDRPARARPDSARTRSGGSGTGCRRTPRMARRNTPIAPICAKKNRPPWGGRSVFAVASRLPPLPPEVSVVVFLEQFGVRIRVEHFVHLVGLLDLDTYNQPSP